eukprot:scaffold115239_cov54-Phaeocystis_antarctica.AAC.1
MAAFALLTNDTLKLRLAQRSSISRAGLPVWSVWKAGLVRVRVRVRVKVRVRVRVGIRVKVRVRVSVEGGPEAGGALEVSTSRPDLAW